MTFQISGLPVAPFTALFGLPDAELARHGAVRRIADRNPGYPCRVSLQDAEPGEALLLLNFEHLAVATPYRASHAIYVREGAQEAHPSPGEIPEVLRKRLLSVRAYDENGMMLNADVADGREIEPVIQRMFDQPKVSYLHLHNAKPGCFAARVDRA